MLRAAAALLLLVNVVFFAWTREWLSPLVPPPHAGEREPERLANQVHPEWIRILAPDAASAAVAAAQTACLEAGPFADAAVADAEAAVAAAGVPPSAVARRDVQPAPAWLVYMGRYGDAALKTKLDELRRLKITPEELRAPAELAPGLALSRHDSRDAAEQALAQFNQRGVHTARVASMPAPAAHWLRVARADAALQKALTAVDGVAFDACAAARPAR